jgi:hypothetical protein
VCKKSRLHGNISGIGINIGIDFTSEYSRSSSTQFGISILAQRSTARQRIKNLVAHQNHNIGIDIDIGSTSAHRQHGASKRRCVASTRLSLKCSEAIRAAPADNLLLGTTRSPATSCHALYAAPVWVVAYSPIRSVRVPLPNPSAVSHVAAIGTTITRPRAGRGRGCRAVSTMLPNLPAKHHERFYNTFELCNRRVSWDPYKLKIA